MRTCLVCGLDVEDSYLFCPDDGSRLVEAQATGPSLSGAYANGEPTMPEASPTTCNAVALYCGECAAEYPLTFVECPVHHALLTRHRLPQTVRQPDKPVEASVGSNPDSDVDARVPMNGRALFASRDEAPGFRVVAAVVVMGLVLFCVAAVYIFFSAGGRKQNVVHASQPDASAATEELAFVPTPDSARDYEAEQPQQQISNEDTQATRAKENETSPAPKASMPRLETTGTESRNTKAETGSTRPTPVSMHRTSSVGSAGSASSAGASSGMSRPSTGRESASPRIDPGSVDARLIRVRSMKTASGVRYDLTFDLQDESGRHSQWERMLVSTRSASGVTQTQTLPFTHRLGANGALTFTVSVEMRGHSEPDWHGRVVCTTTGADFDGRPLWASFAANITP